jgi:hypothetical protein
MSNEIEDILEDEEETIEETPIVETKSEKKKLDLSFMDKPADEWTTDDADAAKKYALTLKAQKEHFKAKATAKVEEPNKLKQETPNLTNVSEEIDIRFMKRDGISDEDIEQLKFIQAGIKAQGKDVSLMEAQTNPLYQAYQENKKLQARRESAQIISSGQPLNSEGKPLTDEEFEAVRKADADAVLAKM